LPELKVQLISKSLYVCLPRELLQGDSKIHPPLNIEPGDTLVASRTKTGILYEPAEGMGSIWRLIPEG
jgi:hypothetical protein